MPPNPAKPPAMPIPPAGIATLFCDIGERPIVHRRPQRREAFRFDHGPRHEQRLIQVHLERDRPARHQRHAHVLPVLVRGVLDDGPALQRRLAVLVEHQPIAALPHRRFDDITDLHRPLSFAAKLHGDAFLLAVVGIGEHIQRAVQFAVEHRVEEAHALHLFSGTQRMPSAHSRLS